MDYYPDKRGGQNKILHFGKRSRDEGDTYFASEPNVLRRSHSLMHFGKRDDNFQDEQEPNENSYAQFKRYHSLMHFGKRNQELDSSESAQYNVNPKRPEHNHNILRFGRSVSNSENVTNKVARRKRYADFPDYLMGWKGSLFAPSSKFEKVIHPLFNLLGTLIT